LPCIDKSTQHLVNDSHWIVVFLHTKTSRDHTIANLSRGHSGGRTQDRSDNVRDAEFGHIGKFPGSIITINRLQNFDRALKARDLHVKVRPLGECHLQDLFHVCQRIARVGHV